MNPADSPLPAIPRRRRRRWRILRWALLSLLGLVVLAYLFVTGPRDLGRYPPGATSPYRLPWPAGRTILCTQSNRGIVSHRDFEEFAYDFSMPVGSDVCAARAGQVKRIVIDHDGHGLHMPNNLIAIDHGDGTTGWYLHLQKDGALVKLGQRVRQGEIIARSGHVGRSLAPHLHFHVTDDAQHHTVPISFSDVSRQRGVPRMLFFYTSGNTRMEEDAN